MIAGSIGPLRPKHDYVVSTKLSSGYTRFGVPSDKDAITLVSRKNKCMTITKLSLNVAEICSNDTPLKVKMVFVTCSGKKVGLLHSSEASLISVVMNSYLLSLTLTDYFELTTSVFS